MKINTQQNEAIITTSSNSTTYIINHTINAYTTTTTTSDTGTESKVINYSTVSSTPNSFDLIPILSACISSFNELSLRVEPFNEDAFVCRILDAGLGVMNDNDYAIGYTVDADAADDEYSDGEKGDDDVDFGDDDKKYTDKNDTLNNGNDNTMNCIDVCINGSIIFQRWLSLCEQKKKKAKRRLFTPILSSEGLIENKNLGNY
ncbi:hypothetical protein MS3_00006713 [Schistosoma haematobium]|uniref:Uncharacterized protein n=1 Tax=Schistosoma haematobium TaxID=6185 RepID=A0A6A5DGI3_SCHHA|nr:hypothetical protein MS3_00006713 [Schistosoma haematobium]KAH9594536.1 hypothetical protein MS3_00006713 [Schistosoma haematobium]